MSRVLAVVVSYNNPGLTRDCLEGLLAQNERPTILVWDNNSDDATVAMLQEYEDKIDHLILSAENKYWTPAINAAVKHYWAGEDYILMLNNDIWLPPDAVGELVATCEATGAGATAPWGAGLGGMQDKVVWESKIPGADPLRVATLVGACMMVPSEVWFEIGPLDENMPLGADDHDYCMRIKHAGYPIYLTRSFSCAHAGHASMRTVDGPKQWEDKGGPSWRAFNAKWAGYFATEEEAVKCQWGYQYNDGWDVGTGWDDVTYYERVIKGSY